jgi:hypothetical protein
MALLKLILAGKQAWRAGKAKRHRGAPCLRCGMQKA